MATAAELNATDARLLNLVQQAIPLTPRPFQDLGEQVGLEEVDVLERLRVLRNEAHVIRQISAIFDTAALGYQSSLVAARIAPDRLEEAAKIVSEHPGVSHNYQRQHAFNLWYTLAVGPDSPLGLEGTVERLKELSGAESMRLLPTLRLFKIGVKFDLGTDAGDDNVRRGAFTEADRAIARQHELSLHDRRLVLALQQDLPLVPRPFDGWAEEADCTTGELLSAAQRFLDRRQMRRFSAVLHHRKAGVVANVMAVWAVDPDEAQALGERMAQFEAVSHCYLRPRYEDWPYNLFTMVHARSKDEALATLEQMQAATGIADYQPLWTLREFKKVRLRYFTDEIARWESRQG